MIANKEVLKDGKVLNELVERFIKEPIGNNLYSIFLCLIDSDLQVPMKVNVKDEDIKEFRESKSGDIVTLKNELRFKPDYLEHQTTHKIYFPIFSTIEEATKEYSDNFSWINLDIDTCIKFVDDNKNWSGLLLNAFTKPLIIEGEIYDILKDVLKDKRKENPIEITKSNIKNINYDNVIAITISESGAMGEPNGLYIVDKDMYKYHSNLIFGEVSNKELLKKFPVLKKIVTDVGEIYHLDKKRNYFDLGMGNYLLIRKYYYDEYKNKIIEILGSNYYKADLYKKWYDILRLVVNK